MARCFDRHPAHSDEGPLPLFWPALVVRNAKFAVILLAHGFARLLRPAS